MLIVDPQLKEQFCLA